MKSCRSSPNPSENVRESLQKIKQKNLKREKLEMESQVTTNINNLFGVVPKEWEEVTAN